MSRFWPFETWDLSHTKIKVIPHSTRRNQLPQRSRFCCLFNSRLLKGYGLNYSFGNKWNCHHKFFRSIHGAPLVRKKILKQLVLVAEKRLSCKERSMIWDHFKNVISEFRYKSSKRNEISLLRTGWFFWFEWCFCLVDWSSLKKYQKTNSEKNETLSAPSPLRTLDGGSRRTHGSKWDSEECLPRT